jgi:hypothetical protein
MTQSTISNIVRNLGEIERLSLELKKEKNPVYSTPFKPRFSAIFEAPNKNPTK